MEITETTPEAMNLRNHNTIEPVLTRRLQQFVEGRQLVHGTRVSCINKLAVHAPAAAVDEPAHRPKLEGAGRISPGGASIQCAKRNRGLGSHVVILSRDGSAGKPPGQGENSERYLTEKLRSLQPEMRAGMPERNPQQARQKRE
jgi:hypothetical protein